MNYHLKLAAIAAGMTPFGVWNWLTVQGKPVYALLVLFGGLILFMYGVWVDGIRSEVTNFRVGSRGVSVIQSVCAVMVIVVLFMGVTIAIDDPLTSGEDQDFENFTEYDPNNQIFIQSPSLLRLSSVDSTKEWDVYKQIREGDVMTINYTINSTGDGEQGNDNNWYGPGFSTQNVQEDGNLGEFVMLDVRPQADNYNLGLNSQAGFPNASLETNINPGENRYISLTLNQSNGTATIYGFSDASHTTQTFSETVAISSSSYIYLHATSFKPGQQNSDAFDANVSDLTFIAEDNNIVSGTVNDTDNDPIDGALVEFRDGGTVVASDTTDANGEYSVTLDTGDFEARASKNGYQNASEDVSITGDTTINFQLAESLPPYVSAADPRQNRLLNDQSALLNATIRDQNGDDIDWEVYHRNGTDGSFQLVDSGTNASGDDIQVAKTSGRGINQWKLNLSDGVQNQESPIFQYRTPGKIRVWNGSTLATLDTTTVTAVIQATESNVRETRTTNDGNVSLNNLDDETYLVQLSATNFLNQTIIVDDVAQSYDVVLYPNSSSGLPEASLTYEQEFTLDDQTGDFNPGDSWVILEAYIDGAWREAASDSFGSNNLASVNLQDGVRYRIKVTNNLLSDDPESIRSLGSFVANSDFETQDPIQLVIEATDRDELDSSPDGIWTYSAELDGDGPSIKADFAANDANITNVSIRIFERGNESNEIFNEGFGIVDNISHTEPLTAEQANNTWTVEFTVIDNGTEEVVRVNVGKGQRNQFPELPNWIQEGAAIVLILMTGTIWSRANVEIGALVTAVTGGIIYMVGWTNDNLTAGTVVLALLIGLFLKYGSSEP